MIKAFLASLFVQAPSGPPIVDTPASPSPAIEKLEKFTTPPQEKPAPLKKLEKFHVTQENPKPEKIFKPVEGGYDSEDVFEPDAPDEPPASVPEKKSEPLDFRYPIQFTPEPILSSAGYMLYANAHHGFVKFQFHVGQYKMFAKTFEKYSNFLLLKPRLGFGVMANSRGAKGFWAETFNNIKITGDYGAGFKVIIEGKAIEKKRNFNGYLQAFLYKHFDLKPQKWLSVYVGYSSSQLVIDLQKDFKEYMKEVRELMSQKEGLIAGIYFTLNKFKTLSFGAETNVQDFMVATVYYGF